MSNSQSQPVALDRRAFVKALIERCPDALVVAGLGSATYDVFAAGDRPKNFYLWGAMGGAAAIGLGLALAQPAKQVLVITGDGEQLMGIGMLATIGAQSPKNLTIVVLDNGHYGETGMQRSHTSLGTNLAAVARACGIAQAFEGNTMAVIDKILDTASQSLGPVLAQVAIKAEDVPRALPSRDGVYIKNRFRAELGLAPL